MIGLGLVRPPDVSAEGWRIDSLLDVTVVMIAVAAALALAWLCAALVAHRARSGRRARYTHGTSRRQVALPLACAALVFLVIDGTLLVRSSRDLDHVLGRAAAGDERALRVQVNARQWSWEFRYAGRDGEFATADDVVVTDHLVVPVDRPVAIELAASDVVHGFHLPNLRVKRDAVPGRVTRVGFTAVETGEFAIACAQFCGVHHYKMTGRLSVLPPERFAAWLQAAEEDAVGIAAEEARAQAEEPEPEGERGFPRWERPVGRDWGWRWGEGR